MSYNKKVWKSGDRITKEALNNMENGIEAAHQNSGGSGTSYDDTAIKTDINTIKTDLGTEELTTTAKNIKGAVNEVAAQYKDIAKKTIIEDNKLYLIKEDGTKIDEGTVLSTSSGTANIVTKNSNVKNIGEIFKKPNDYTAWPLGNVQYDKIKNKICMVIPSKGQHTSGQTKLYFCNIDLNTYEVSELSLLAEDETYGCTSQSFCILNDSTYMCIVRVHEVNNIDTIVDTRKYISTDYGETWTNNGDLGMIDGTKFMTISGLWKSVTCMIQLSNNRLIASVNNRIIYSDNSGTTWTLLENNPSGVGEIFLLELSNGKVLAIGRKIGVSPGATKGPAMISTSTDYGSTWTDFSASTTILDQTANPSFGVYYEDERLVELFYCSRYSDGIHNGFIYSQIATENDAINDKFGTANIIGYSKQPETGNNGINFGYMAGAKDFENNVHLFYYDSDDTGVNWNYMKSSRTQVTFPISDNTQSIIGMWSSNKINDRIKALLLPLQTKLNELIISSGGTIDKPEYGNMYITNDLVVYFDFMDKSTINTSNKTITDKKNKIVGKFVKDPDNPNIPIDTDITIYEHWVDNNVVVSDNLQSLITNYVSMFTIEFIGYVDSNVVATGQKVALQVPKSYYYVDRFSDCNFVNSVSGLIINKDKSEGKSFKYFASRNAALSEGSIFQAVAVFNSDGTINLYRNGIPDDGHYGSTPSDFKQWDTSAFSKGLNIANKKRALRIYNRCLTAEEIANNYKFEQTKFKSEIN